MLSSSHFVIAADNCKKIKLTPKAHNLVKTALIELTKGRSKKGNYSAHYSKFWSHLNYIEKNKNAGTTEAIAYLLFLQIGDHSLKELQCEALRRGKNIIPIIHRFKKCLPLTGLEPLPKFMTKNVSPRPDIVIDRVNKGIFCYTEE